MGPIWQLAKTLAHEFHVFHFQWQVKLCCSDFAMYALLSEAISDCCAQQHFQAGLPQLAIISPPYLWVNALTVCIVLGFVFLQVLPQRWACGRGWWSPHQTRPTRRSRRRKRRRRWRRMVTTTNRWGFPRLSVGCSLVTIRICIQFQIFIISRLSVNQLYCMHWWEWATLLLRLLKPYWGKETWISHNG